MFINKYPTFHRGRVLKPQMLESLRDFPIDVFDTYIYKYSNGIVAGCELTIDDDYIIISPGIIRFNKVNYLLNKNHLIQYENFNDLSILKVKFSDKKSNKDFQIHDTEIFIDRDTNIYKDELELCRFKLKTGAKLRTNYTDFEDMVTEYNTLNIISSPYSGYEKSTLSPIILRNFAKEALNYNLTNSFDICFCMQCMENNRPLDRELILSYISSRLGVENKDYSNERIFNNLNKILREIKTGNKSRLNTINRDNVIIVD